MIGIIYTALLRPRTVLMLFALVFISGLVSYIIIPRESSPNVTVPYVNISIHHEGISPEDADRLLVKPIYNNLKVIEGLKEVNSTASLSRAYVTLEFEQNIDIDKALLDVRERVESAKNELPDDTDEPDVSEYNMALQPVLTVTLSGDNIDERVLISVGKKLKDQIDALGGVLSAELRGDREEVLEILIDPYLLESYNIKQSTLFNLVSRNNKLVAAGTLDTDHGRFAVKVPGLFESYEDILNLPVKQTENHVVTLGDIATVYRGYKDATSIARLNGQSMLSLDISKRIGANIINMADDVKASIELGKHIWPEGISVNYLQDESQKVRRLLSDLENSVMFATILVMIVIIATLGFKSAMLVGIAIPGSFLIGILCLSLNNMTLNMVVLFSLILAVGMLVDGTIVVTEYADRRRNEGASRRDAYAEAAIRMAWPITSSTATTLAVFAPLLFWPGIMGQFMSYLPMTLIFTLSASLVMAMIVVPTLGSLGDSKPLKFHPTHMEHTTAPKMEALNSLQGYTAVYISVLKRALLIPKKILLSVIGFLIFTSFIYAAFGHGTVFFPDRDPEFGTVHIKARGELSLKERDKIVKEVEEHVLQVTGIHQVYSSTYARSPQRAAQDVIGLIRLELSDWKTRTKANVIFSEIRTRTEHMAGIVVEARAEKRGPTSGRDIELEISAASYPKLVESIELFTELFKNTEGLIDVQDSRPPAGYEWQFKVDREKASQYGADLSDVGNTIRLVTNGISLGEYRPDNADDEVDIRIRYPANSRNLDQFSRLRIAMGDKLVPIDGFVTQNAQPKLNSVKRTDGRYTLKVEADVEDGYLANNLIKQLAPQVKKILLAGDGEILAKFRGQNEDQKESMIFLMKAFGVALFVMSIILVTQFNSFYQALLILSAVIFSIIGVLMGLLIKGEPFSIVMSGVGVIALAGIVVNNNIVLIDTFNILIKQGLDPIEAALHTGAQRLRPVMLTTVTTILGLVPMASQINIKLLSQEIDIGAPSGQYWVQLATAIAGGLAFATVLTLVLTPCLLVLGKKTSDQNSAG